MPNAIQPHPKTKWQNAQGAKRGSTMNANRSLTMFLHLPDSNGGAKLARWEI